VPEDMPEHIAEDMPGRMPEDLPVTKRIDVMVGITRSKVYNCGLILRVVGLINLYFMESKNRDRFEVQRKL